MAACAHTTSPASSAAGRAAEYLHTRGNDLDPNMAFLLAYVQRKFRLPWAQPLVDNALGRVRSGELPQLAPFLRLADPDAPPAETKDVKRRLGVDRLTVPALDCDRQPLPPGYLGQLAAATQAGGYEATHAALGLAWARERGCLSAEAAATLARLQTDQLVAILSTRIETDDLFAEALALLLHSGERRQVRRGWIDALLAAQHPDGGWGLSPAEPSDDHTTTLALWVLLEWNGSNSF